MATVNVIILLIGLLLLLAIAAGLVSSRIGAPLLLVFLGLGMLAGEDGPGGILFSDYHLAYLIGSLALAVILFDGGLRTRAETFRTARWPALTLATVGVLATAVLTGAIASWALDIGWKEGFLVGAIVASTDAAAVFFLLHLRGLGLRERVSATLEVESGLNDPMAVFLTLLAIGLVAGPSDGPSWESALDFAVQLLGGAAIGVAAGTVLVHLINRLDIADGLYPILALSAALFVFGAAQSVGSSGFMAVYLAGFVLGNRRHRADLLIRRFHDGLAWLAQITLFVMLGLLVTPSALAPIALPGLLVGVALLLVARPVAVALCLAPFRFAWNETMFIAWVGLRGAVPIVLGTMPVLAGLPGASVYFGVAFIVVILSLVVQGWTIGPAARLLEVDLPPEPEPPLRTDFDLPGSEAQLALFTVAPESMAARRGAGRLVLPEGIRVLALIQDGRMVPIEEVRTVRPGDAVLALGPPRELARLDRLFGQRTGRDRAGRSHGDFQVQGDIPVRKVGELYAFDAGADGDLSVGAYVARRLGRPPSLGDRVRVGTVDLVVAALDASVVTEVGIDLSPPERWMDGLVRRVAGRFLGR